MSEIICETKDIWFVWTKNGRKPRFAHSSEEQAIAEAKRLATLLPGSKFLVMHATHKFSVKTLEQQSPAS